MYGRREFNLSTKLARVNSNKTLHCLLWFGGNIILLEDVEYIVSIERKEAVFLLW